MSGILFVNIAKHVKYIFNTCYRIKFESKGPSKPLEKTVLGCWVIYNII